MIAINETETNVKITKTFEASLNFAFGPAVDKESKVAIDRFCLQLLHVASLVCQLLTNEQT